MSSSSLCDKKRKRVGERVFKFKSFGENGYPTEFDGSFRENIKALVEFGNSESCLCDDINGGMMSCWSFQLEVQRQSPFYVLFFVFEEDVEASSPSSVLCSHCLYVGWGHDMVCNKKYHFVLPSKEVVEACFNCGGELADPTMTNYYYKSNLVELGGHILHGVFHSNGVGHLLSVNGLETGSRLSGHQIMDFWDRLCTGLKARKVCLNDASKKQGMELRLLHGLAYGQPWFGRWGYEFRRGCYGVIQEIYQKAIETLKGIPLCLLINHHTGIPNDDVPLIFSKYQTLSDNSLITLGDLFHFMLELKSRLPRENPNVDSFNPAILGENTCRWSSKRVEAATRVIVEALKMAEFRWVSRQEVRDIARSYIGDTGLLDFVLKSLGNHIVGNYLVRRCLNPVTKVLEYRLENISSIFPEQRVIVMNKSRVKSKYNMTITQLTNDIVYLYKQMVKESRLTSNTTVSNTITMAVRIILDAKYFVKVYEGDISLKLNSNSNGRLKLLCTLILRNDNIEDVEESKNPFPPYECITLDENATFDELKLEVQKIFREIYWGMRDLVVESAVNLSVKGTDLVSKIVEMGEKVVFLGSKKNGGVNQMLVGKRIVDCVCGCKEEDGERLISCDICEVWQHTWCVHISNNEEIPHIFLCNKCEQKILLLPSLP